MDLALIKSRLQQFKSLPESEYLKEHLFCLITPQSKAQKCWEAIDEISKLKNPTEKQISKILSTKTRFHHTKAKRIIIALSNWNNTSSKLNDKDVVNLRNWLSDNINGYGLKEASHFLRNIGKSNNKIAILDRHIIRKLGIEKVRTNNHYYQVEDIFLNKASDMGLKPDELDLLWWSQENGEIFK
jgi:N-glycosylase/DNA lyase